MNVAVFSSTPDSMIHAEKTIQSIVNQSVELSIFWHLPTYSKRLKKAYPDPGAWLSKYPSVQVDRCEDIGPNTKVYPLLETDTLRNAKRVIVFDDDVIYHPDAVKRLIDAQTSDKYCTGYRGHTFRYIPFIYSDRGAFNSVSLNRVSVLMGTGMILFPADVFKNVTKSEFKKYIRKDKLYFINDDHVYAHYAYKSGYPMYIVSQGKDTMYNAWKDNETALKNSNNPARECEIKMMSRGELAWPVVDTLVILFVIFILIILLIR